MAANVISCGNLAQLTTKTIMDYMLDAYVGYDIGSVAEPDDIPRTDDTVWILGKQYRAIEGDCHY